MDIKKECGWWMPQGETHLPEFLQRAKDVGQGYEYQVRHRNTAIKYCRKRRVAIDVGASLGMWSRQLCQNFGLVMCFEPVPIFVECLQKNLAKFTNWELYECAVGNYEGYCEMNVTLDNTGNTHVTPFQQKGDTPILRLDSLEIPIVDLIKIDVEGCESEVVRGAQRLLQEQNPVVVVEQKDHAKRYKKERFNAVNFLKSLGYKLIARVSDDFIMRRKGK